MQDNKGSGFGTVVTSLWYLRRLPLYKKQKPYFVNFPVSSNGEDAPPQHNVLHEQINNIAIRDIRGHESDFALDTHGFELSQHETSLTDQDFESDQIIREKYYPEIIKFVSEKLGATRVVPFEHTHRLSAPLSKGCGCSRKRKPLVAAHIDQTPASSAQRMRYHLGDKAESLLQKRFQVINVWRPLFGPLRDFPLTVGDFRSFDLTRDGEPTDLVFPHYVGESMNLYYNPEHLWYYYSNQMRNQVWIFKCHDSQTDVATGMSVHYHATLRDMFRNMYTVVAPWAHICPTVTTVSSLCSVYDMHQITNIVQPAAPHCSFDIQDGAYTERLRESIEIRLLVMYDE